MRRPFLTVIQYSFMTDILAGIGFLTLGLLTLFMQHLILGIIVSLLVLVMLTVSLVSRKENADEMARAHQDEAYHLGFLMVLVILTVFQFAEFAFDADIRMMTVVNFCFGAGYLTIGLKFQQLERAGDA